MTATKPAKRSTPRKAAAKVNGTGRESDRPLSGAAAPVKFSDENISATTGPYGNKQTYTFKPAKGEPIVFPHITEVEADAHFFWKIYTLNEMFQAFEWMNRAGVPRAIQERVMLLDDDEKAKFFNEWFSAVTTPQGVAPPGES